MSNLKIRTKKPMPAETDEEIQARLNAQVHRKELISRVMPFTGLALLIVFFAIVTKGGFLKGSNLVNLINQCFSLVIICIGATFIHGHGGSDFSVGAVCGCTQLVSAYFLTILGLPLWFCLLSCVLVAVAATCTTATIRLAFGVPAFVGSMCIRTAFSGILTTVTQKQEFFISSQTYGFMDNFILKAVVLVVFVVGGYYLFEYTSLGKNLRAIGGNVNTARQAGIKTKKNIYMAYILLGICVGVAAIFQMFRSGAVTSNSGNGLEFNTLMAIVLGGFPMHGGEKAKLSSAITGALTVTILMNGLALWGLDTNMINLVKGVLFVSIVGLAYDKSKGKLVEQ